MAKIVKQELEFDDTLLQCFNALESSTFIELSNSSVGEDLTPLSSLKRIFQFGTSLLSEPCTPMGSI
jgi:hypothetical protein